MLSFGDITWCYYLFNVFRCKFFLLRHYHLYSIIKRNEHIFRVFCFATGLRRAGSSSIAAYWSASWVLCSWNGDGAYKTPWQLTRGKRFPSRLLCLFYRRSVGHDIVAAAAMRTMWYPGSAGVAGLACPAGQPLQMFGTGRPATSAAVSKEKVCYVYKKNVRQHSQFDRTLSYR